MIDINKKYRTRDGREVRIYATDEGCGVASVHGAIKTKDGIWHVYSWSEDGLSIFGRERHEDLIEVRRRHKRTVWVTVYPMNRYQISDENIQCDIYPPKRIACIKVELDFEEGEGL
jgi:hypothetical protein